MTDDRHDSSTTDTDPHCEMTCEYALGCPETPADACEFAPDEASPSRSLDRFLAAERAEMDRRDLAKVLATFGGLAALGSLAAPLAGLTRVFERSYEGPIYSDGVALIDAEGEQIEENRLEMGDLMTVFPESHPGIEPAPTLLVRYPEGEYGGATEMEFTVSGYAAYSKVCTHAGCMVSDRQEATMVCPCHFGKFDALEGATVTGGPPPRPLPQLPLTLSEEGFLIATADFEGPVGTTEE